MKLELKSILKEIAVELSPEQGESIVLELMPPKNDSHGDLSTDLGFRLAKILRMAPTKCAEQVLERLNQKIKERGADSWIHEVKVVPPGFLNFYLKDTFFASILKKIREEDEEYGRSDAGAGEKVVLEYVSANPTGPLTIAHGRQACVGDALARILDAAGYRPHREYYMNDAGRQINLLGKSLHARYAELIGEDGYEFPEDGYQGEYIADLAKEVKEVYGEEFKGKADPETEKFFSGFAKGKIFETIQEDLKAANVAFDTVFSEVTLYQEGLVEKSLKVLRERNMLYESDGALWLKTEQAGDDKDRVLKKTDGSYTYLTPDIAYHQKKFDRGFKKIVNLWGPDHHGYIARLKAAVQELGYDPTAVHILIVQLTTLYRDGEPVRMSTRKGEFITFRELLDEVGCDAARFFFLVRRIESHLDFDLELAKKKSDENPVFYMQYAHARICSILKKIERPVSSDPDLSLLNTPEELSLIRFLGEFPDMLAQSAHYLEPYSVVDYLRSLAQIFHRFYTFHRVISDDQALSDARIYLISCCRIVIRNGLNVLGVSSPEQM